MKNYTLFKAVLFLLSITSMMNAQNYGWQWAVSAGSPDSELCGTATHNSSPMATDAAGNCYITGMFNATAVFGNYTLSTQTDKVFVAKYDVNGTCLWARQFGGNLPSFWDNQGCSISLDNQGNCYVAGHIYGASNYTVAFGASTLTCNAKAQLFLLKYDANGNEQWARQATGNSISAGNGIVSDSYGNTYMTGVHYGNIVVGNTTLPGSGSFVIKHDANGNLQWATPIGNQDATMGICIDVDAGGNCVFGGFIQGSETYATTPPTTLSSADYWGSGYQSALMGKIGNTGNLQWVRKLNSICPKGASEPSAFVRGISLDGNGNIFMTGAFNGTMVLNNATLVADGWGVYNAYVIKCDPAGIPQWALSSHDTADFIAGSVEGMGIKALANGECYTTGRYRSNSSSCHSFGNIPFPKGGNNSVYVMKISATGVPAWCQFSDGTQTSAIPAAIGLDAAGSIYLAGTISGNPGFGPTTLSSINNSNDVFVAKLNAPDPNTVGMFGASLFDRPRMPLSVYPNPFKSSVTFDVRALQGKGGLTIRVFNALGLEVGRLENILSPVVVMERGDLPSGIYSYQLADHTGTLAQGKLVME